MNTEMKKTVVYSTGDKILNIMKEQDMDIPELSLRCGVREDVLMDILAGIREADISTLCKIADGLETTTSPIWSYRRKAAPLP